MKKDNLTSVKDEGSMPDVEIPGTKLGLKTIVDIARSVFGIYPKHVSGDIVVPVSLPLKAESPSKATVTVYVTRGRNRSSAISVVSAADDVESLVRLAAETVLGQVNPYVLAAYREDRREYEKAVELIERMIQSPTEDRRHKEAAFNLWGNALKDQTKYDEAIAKYQTAIELDPKDPLPYYNWGAVLYSQKKYSEAIAKYQRVTELDPKLAAAYYNWGTALYSLNRGDEAVAKWRTTIELDPRDALPYNAWGNVLSDHKKYDEAITKYQKAIELNPKFAAPYTNWGVALRDEGKYDEAMAKLKKAVELSQSQ
jgi:tetratricopeptide (TPR) repeat protein